MKTKITFLLIFLFQFAFAQVDYGTPSIESLPEKLKSLKVEIEVIHFPKENDPIKIKDKYYNDKWNLRKSYDLKDLDKNFGTKKQVMSQGEPYVWSKNWRVDTRLFGGWAMWYFIGVNDKGETICGYETINTTSNLLNK